MADPIRTAPHLSRSCRFTFLRDVDPELAAIFVAEFIVWWHEAGQMYYGWNATEQDEGLIEFAQDAVCAFGGWRAARRALQPAGKRSFMRLPKSRSQAAALTAMTCPSCGQHGVREAVFHGQLKRFCSWCGQSWVTETPR